MKWWKLTDIKVLKFEVDSMIWCKREEIWNTRFYKSWLTPPKKNQILQSFVMFGGWKLTDTKVLKFGVDTKDKKSWQILQKPVTVKAENVWWTWKTSSPGIAFDTKLSKWTPRADTWLKSEDWQILQKPVTAKIAQCMVDMETSSPGIASKLSSLR